jgi:TetR/AcrR family transcriptional regulator, mexJK operon transcriptional repressor
MARLAGQIDLSKNEAILDAALEVLSQRGLSASMEEIARRACVSKQTIYNHYGSKAELVRAIAARRVHEMTAAFETPEGIENPAEALASFARVLLTALHNQSGYSIYRMAVLNAPEMPDIARAMYEAGPRGSRRKLADYLAVETRAGRLACPDAMEAAEFFAGMVIGSTQTASLLGIDVSLDEAKVERLATEATARFLKAYAP